MTDQRLTAPPADDRCPRCGGVNRCALAAGAPIDSCWCHAATARLPVPAAATSACYCPDCLRASSGVRIEETGDAR